MATYLELYGLRSNDDLRNKIAVATGVKAQGLLAGASPTIAQVEWAVDALESPVGKAGILINYVLAANKDLAPEQITGATDAAIQANVDAAVDAITTGGI